MGTIACFGDSLIEGFPFGPECSWCAFAEAGAEFRLLNYGVCGECCADIYDRLVSTSMPKAVSGILFLGGANDLLMGRKPQNALIFIKKAARWAEDQGLKFGVVLPLLSADLGLNRGLAELAGLIKEEMPEVFKLDLQEGIGYGAEELCRSYVDGVHPTVVTYKKMGAVARPQIADWLEK